MAINHFRGLRTGYLVLVAMSLVMAPVWARSEESVADQLFISNRFEQARLAYTQEAHKYPDKIAPKLGLIRTLMRLDRWEDGLEVARQAVASTPQDADAHGMLALMLVRAGLPDAAATEAEHALALRSDCYWGLIASGRIDVWNHRMQEAREVLLRAVALHPDWPEARYYMVDATQGNQVTKADIEDVNAYLKLAPRGHPHDLAVEAMSSRLPLLLSFIHNTPFQADSPYTETQLEAADRGEAKDFALTVPIEREDGYIILPLELNGKKFKLLFDTGGGSDITLYQSAVDRLKLPLLTHSTIYGVSGKEPSRIYKADTMRIGTMTYRSIPIESVNSSLGNFDGIMGVSIFDDYLVTVDFEHNLLTLARGKTATPPPPAAGNHLVTVPFHYVDGDILIPVTIEGHSAWTVVDTGADNYALLSLRLAREIARSRPKNSYREGGIEGKMGIGNSRTRTTMLVFSDPVSLRLENTSGPAFNVGINPGIGASPLDTEISPSGDFQLDALLGITFLMTAERVSFDYPHRMLTLEIAGPSGK